jgi:hypothetical protein
MTILILTIPHKNQRYPTCGDWQYDKEHDVLTVKVSDTGNGIYNYLIGLHELAEAQACMFRGISEKVVDRFDMDFEANRRPGNDDEPGDDIDAPYKHEHCFATGIERITCAFLGIPWETYSNAIEALDK